ncbi:Two-component response regulator-like protein [Morus notabilis]|uniref:Two-component response regulator-like protein n=1 Tax=Morus notabilis TaxID=981085 RepID=W9QJJ2_9ROSA|nr:two-component response regulator-like APRR1 [Morus notabilis]EXB38554.1 Two-component response regulator-like protein [Morus notabilis]
MERKELNLNKDCDGGDGCGGGGGGGGRGDGFIDRSKVRILLCDNDADSSKEIVTLLLKCSYQVICVRSARQVIDALNAEGPDIDIILADLDLPLAKGMKMLKYITRDKDLRRIPVIMMSAQDEISIVVKCLRLGAADYLVKPLRTNELLNLWTHMWRRRRMLGLAEKNILNYEFDLVVSDPSDANTNSTTLFSDDTDDKSRKATNQEAGMSVHQEDEESAAATAVTAVEPRNNLVERRFDMQGNSNHQTGQFSSGPRKSELKIGESSAFFTYVKSSIIKNNSQAVSHVEANAAQHLRLEEKRQAFGNPVVEDTQVHENGEVWESYSQGDDLPSSTSIPDSLSMERSCTPPAPRELPNENNFMKDRFSNAQVHPRNGTQNEDSGLPAQAAYPYCMSGVVNQVMITSSGQVCQKDLLEMQNHATSVMMPQYNHLPQCPPHLTGMTSFPYYPVSICLQPGQMPTAHTWQSFGSSSSSEVKLNNKVDRREAALIKFRQKRKERCFDKKIRYVNRKRLAERRPRVRGQFVRKVNGVNVDLNGQPASADYDEDEEDDEALASMDSTPEDCGSGY